MTMPSRPETVLPPFREGAGETGWERELRDAFVSADALCEFLGTPVTSATGDMHDEAVRRFPLLVPRSFARRMVAGDPDDPLLRQVLPRIDETETRPGYSADPVGDAGAEVVPGLLRKYNGRALLLLSGACAVHCRFCFRKHMVPGLVSRDPGPALKRLHTMTDIGEVILSGGDPLLLPDRSLEALLASLCEMSHLCRIRIHTRMATVMPSRISGALVEMIQRADKQIVVVLHVNHPNELNHETAEALAALRRGNALILNQSVLLKGVNDSHETLLALSERLVAQGALPYYLHQLDRAQGTHHFEVPEEVGLRLVEGLRAACPGYMVPRFVKEEVGRSSKTPLVGPSERRDRP